MKAVLDHIDTTAAHIKTFWFRPEKPLRYTAGQFTELTLPHVGVDGRGNKRWFTLVSSPTEPLVAIATTFSADTNSTFKQTLLSLRPGDKVVLAEPMGDFVLPKDANIPLLFVASGIGITPVRSIIKYLQDTGEQRHIHLLYGIHEANDLAYGELLETYLGDVTPHITSESGRLTVEDVLRVLSEMPERTVIYISGPEAQVETLTKQLQQASIAPDRVVSDYFCGY